MKRVVWVAVTLLIMIGILGYGLHTLNRIEEVNQQRREKEAGNDFVAKITMTTASTSIWDRRQENQWEKPAHQHRANRVSCRQKPPKHRRLPFRVSWRQHRNRLSRPRSSSRYSKEVRTDER